MAELLQSPMVVKGAEAEWGACFRTVLLNTTPQGLSYWNNVIAIGSWVGDIITLDAITGSRIAVLSGHTSAVQCITFSSDGKSLASGSRDSTVKLWDMQTGGVVRIFPSHTGPVSSVSISTDYTRIVSGSYGGSIYLWDIQTGDCLCTLKQQDAVYHVSFSPINPQHIISISGNKVWEWDLNGQQIAPTYNSAQIAFSPNCTKFALYSGGIVTIQDSTSREIETQFHVDAEYPGKFCFSPDGKLIAAVAHSTAYVWDITGSEPHLVGHYKDIQAITFSSPSSLISISFDQSVRFWQIGVLPTDSAITNPDSAPLISPEIISVSLQARTGIAISYDKEGVVKTWDISTGLCKMSFHTTAGGYDWGDAGLIDGRLIVFLKKVEGIYIWDTSKNDPPKIIATLSSGVEGLRISGDGSKLFCLFQESIQALSIPTGEHVGEVKLKLEQEFWLGQELQLGQEFWLAQRHWLDHLQLDDSKIWVQFKDLSTQGWDFGVSNSPPIQLSDGPTKRPLLNLIGSPLWQTEGPCLIKNTVTRKEVFQLSGRYIEPTTIRWDGQYLVAGYRSGEVLILDFHHLYPQ